MRFRLLGPFEVLGDAGAVPIGAQKQRALLCLLLLHANEVVSADRLVDHLWGERPPRTAANALQGYVSQLRKLLARAGTEPASLVTHPGGYELRVEPQEIDAHRFEALLQEGRQALAAGRPELAAPVLAEALALWRGPALADFTYEPWAQNEIARLEELRLVCLEEGSKRSWRSGSTRSWSASSKAWSASSRCASGRVGS